MRKSILTFVLLLLVSFCAFADRIDDWRRDQTAIEAMLQQKQYADARKASIKLTNRMFDHLGADAEAGRLLAQTVALRAAAEDGLGNIDETNWYRDVAKALDPEIVLPPMTTPVPERILGRVFSPAEMATAKMTAPERTRKRDPERPAIVNELGVAMAVVEVAIDIDGVVRQPRIISSPAPTVSYAALEAVKQWRFRPGTEDGKPVPIRFRLTITMH